MIEPKRRPIALAIALPLLALDSGCESSQHPTSDIPHPTSQNTSSPSNIETRPSNIPPLPSCRLANTQPSERDLYELVLLALKEKDPDLLEILRVTEKEYKEVLYPEFPIAAAGKGDLKDFQWSMIDLHSKGGIANVIGNWGGNDFELVEWIHTRGEEKYKTYRAFDRVELRVRLRGTSEKDGQIQQIRVFGAVIEIDGRYKLLSYKFK